MKLLIIIPAYNEEKNITKVVDDLIQNYPQYDYLIINDGSTDDTLKICKEKGYSYINLIVNLGLAGAIQTGFKYAKKNDYDALVQIDGDGQHLPKYIKNMETIFINDKPDIIIGSRFYNKKRGKSLRTLGSMIISVAILLTTGLKLSDPTSGMRMFNKKMINIFADSINYGPEPDTITYLYRSGAKIQEVAVEMKDREYGDSYLNFITGIKYMTRMLLSIILIQFFRKKEVL